MKAAALIAGAIALLLLCSSCEAKVILVSLDGFRWDYIDIAKKNGTNVSAFEEIAQMGFRAEVQNVFITITFPTHYAIATGRYVENHGLYNNQFRDPIFKQSFSYKNATQQMDPKWLEYNNNEPIWLTNQRHGNRSCVFYWPGSNQPYKGKYPFATSGLYSDDPTFKYRVDRLMDWITNDEFTFCAFYFNEPDHSGHAHGPNSQEVMNAIAEVNDGIAYLLQRIKSHPALNGKVNLIVTADHGMTQIPVENRVHLYKAVNSSSYYGNISPPVVGIWPKKGKSPEILESETDAIYKKLMDAKLPNLTVYQKESIPEKYHYGRSYRMPPILALADPGYLIMIKDDYFTKNPPLGMHGYDNEFREMHPFMVAYGPGIKKKEGLQKFQQVDIYPFICGLLGLQRPNIIDGQIERVLPFMNNPPSEEFVKTFKLYASGIRADP
ncbi:unnamed protein product [Dibothriocephalus latus]|uniref:Ectonucleotide pyrophosphatase/phosphodiesterase family member 5 n=1 Tax=Dibothriocephalus latus TaxID=60516 RepID=A0A3P7L791_DIBLA|nr:unnamed protein product [Dibothriocephalus latus]